MAVLAEMCISWQMVEGAARMCPQVTKCFQIYLWGFFIHPRKCILSFINIVRQDKRMGFQNEHMRRADWQKRKVRVERERSREGLRMRVRVEDATWGRGGWKCHLLEEDLLLPPLRAGEVLSKTFVNFSGFNAFGKEWTNFEPFWHFELKRVNKNFCY